MRYSSKHTSIENIAKAVERPPIWLRQIFYRHTKEIIETNVISLLEFQLWLGGKKDLFNPLVHITASHEPNRKKDLSKTIDTGYISEKGEVKYWFCSKKHKVTTFKDFKSNSINAKKKFC